MTQPTISAEDLERLLVTRLPEVDHHGEVVERVGSGEVSIRLPFQPAFVGAEQWQDGSGAVFSGPVLMAMADTAMYCAAIAASGADTIPVMVTLNISFLQPAGPVDLIAAARVVRQGKRLSHLECWLTSDGAAAPCAHVTATYRIARV